jgi:hypothetical protein
MFNSLPPSDRALFEVDCRVLNWNKYMQLYCYGIKKFMLKQNAMSPVAELNNIVAKNS